MEHIFLPECIRNTPSDAEDITEHKLRVGKSPDHWKGIETHTKLGRMMQGREKEESEQDWNFTCGVGELKQVSHPHIEAIVWTEGTHLSLSESATADL